MWPVQKYDLGGKSKLFISLAHGYDVIKPPSIQQSVKEEDNYARDGIVIFWHPSMQETNGEEKKYKVVEEPRIGTRQKYKKKDGRKKREKERMVEGKNDKPKKQDRRNKEKRKRRAVNYLKFREQDKERTEPQVGYDAAVVSLITRDNFDGVAGPVTCTKEAGTISIPFKHAEGYKTCVFMIDSKEYSSKEKQEGNIIVESNKTFCTLFIKQFSLKTYEHITVSVDADLDRILGLITFGKLLKDKHAAIDNCENGHDDKGLSTGAIAGIVVVVVVIIIVVIVCVLKKKGNGN